ncbi:MAG: copper chaperone PCu(A)C [Anaerolineales bacterium]
MMRRVWLLVAALLLTSCGSRTAGLRVDSAWARPAERGMNSAVYLRIQNGPDPEVLTGAASDVAETVQVHRTILDADGNAAMEELPRVSLAPGEILEMKPGSYHIMLINLRHPLNAGESFDLALYFEKTGEYHVSIPVLEN